MFKIAQPTREFIIGPNSIESLNDLFIMERYAVNSSAGAPQQTHPGSGLRLVDVGHLMHRGAGW
jgi:hypothetical protein